MMIDWFGWKAKAKIEELENEFIKRTSELGVERIEHDNTKRLNDQLILTIRRMDQQIFNMSQCTDWNSMRPIFNNLNIGTTERMKIESNRIQNLLIPEIRKAYNESPDESREVWRVSGASTEGIRSLSDDRPPNR